MKSVRLRKEIPQYQSIIKTQVSNVQKREYQIWQKEPSDEIILLS